MPYNNVPENLWDKMDRCVQKVQDKDASLDKAAAVAICYTSVVEGKSFDVALEEHYKVGARNSRKDATDIQTAHDLMQRLGAKCDAGDVMQQMTGGKADDETLVTFGAEVKALGDGKIGGYLVVFGSPAQRDLTGVDWFASDTDFGNAEKSAVYYHHGLDDIIKRRVFDDGATLRHDEIGVWIEAQLKMRDEYERAIYGMAQKGKLGWSSGTASHLVERDDKTGKITKWPLGLDASLTPTPAEPRTQAVPIKSLTNQPLAIEDEPETEQENRSASSTESGAAVEPKTTSQENTESNTMSDEALNEIKMLLTAQAAEIASLKKVVETAPPISTVPAATVEVTRDPADVPFKTIAENCAAIKSYELSKGQKLHARLTNPALKATGANEGIPNEGGFLLDPTLTSTFLAPTHAPGQFSTMVNRLPVGTNSNYGWINGVDETDRATGSRWGGIRGYRLAEGDTKTPSKPKFRRINWELKKYAVLVYGTDELLQDASQFSVVVRQGVSEEIDFMLNDDIVNGIGAGGPFGILQSPALVSVAKETNQANDTVVYENILKMWARLLPESKRSSATAWFINSEVSPQLDQLAHAVGTAALPPRFVDYGADGVMRMKGKPVYETEWNAALGDQGDIILGDMNAYLLWEKAGIQEATSIHVQFLTDETVFRFVYRVDGQPVLASAVTPYKGSATQSNFVVIDAR